ncbi:PREDICTED: uncharacterized protein LOC106741701 isoform X2 [Dinoponera quadriceps]|uniref:Uncharacterized protein LOC106741701 isoform X2 n=1 Tax=Dinoponera quadriceps TaxID=609295 RepID=A0A6P3WUA6_DINQU|nr:PREDICTED: uncharacterized protein LOC106741701 isoform X2 [Dinoponera quadriceps]
MELNGVGAPIVGAVACPVCTLYLREGISLQKHLDTHPKEQVIDALIKASSSSLQPQQQVQQQQQQQQQQQNASTASAPALVSLPQATPQGSATIQTPQASSQVSQNAHIPAHSPYPIGPIFECPPISTMMPPQFTSFSYQQFVNNGTMMIPQAYAMAPQTNQMMQMLYSPYGMYQQQQIPTVQMISPVTAIPGATRIRPVATMAAENRATVAVPMSSPEPKQILPEILPEPESGQVLSNLPASPLLQSENTTTVRSSREEADGNNALQMDHRMQRTPSSTPPGESIVQHEYNSIPRSIAITCTINSSGVNDKVEMVLPDIQDEEEPLDVGPADLQCASVAYEQPEDAQQFVQQVAEEEGYASDKEIDMSSDAIDPVACETEAVCDERPTSCGATDDDDTPREASVNDAKEPVQPEVESQLENLLITIIETEFSGTSSQKEAQDVHQGERLDEKEKVMADRVESVIHDTVMTTLGCHENDHILPDMQENDAECPNDYVDNELEKTYQHRHVRSAPPSPFAKKEPVFREDAVGSSRHGAYFERPRVGSCDNLILYLRDDDEKVEDAEDNFDEADMEIEEIPSPHTPFARYSNGSAECVRSHTPLSAISGISVLRVRTDLSKPCSPASVHSFCHVDSDSLSHDEDSNSGIDNNVIEKDPIDCSQVEEKIKTDHQQQAMSTVCESTDKVQESGYVYHHHHHHHHHHHQSVITEHVSSFSVNHSQQPQQPVLTHESYSMTSSKTHSLLNLSESINPTTSTESKSFHTTAKSLMPKQPMELLNINEDAHAGPMNVFEFEGLQIIVPSTFISDSSQKAVSATSQQSMASSEGAVGIDEEVKSINMRADETMPPRGELSEQESNGCTEQSAWQLYMGQESSRMSTSYDLLARESWEESEGSDNEISGPLLDSRSLATHFTSSLFLDRDRKTPTKRTFKCYHCSEVFDCPKERRVHSTTVHKGAVPSSSRDQLDQPEVKDIKLLDNRMNVFDDIFVPGLHVQQMYHQQQPLLHQLQPPQPSDLGKAENGDQKIDSLAIPSAIEVTCAICNQRFNSEKSLQVHHKRMHIAESFRAETMAECYDKLSWTEVRDLLRTWREDSERRSRDVVNCWEKKLVNKIDHLGNEKYLVLEQVCVAALDCYRISLAEYCIKTLMLAFPGSLRIHKYHAMHLEALEMYDEALEVLDSIIKRDETNAAPRKRRVAILKARGRIPEAIKELTEYLKRFMSDQEAWHELCDLYLQEQEYSKAAYCMEELILHNPHSHLIYQRYAEIKYSQGGFDNMELAKAYFCQAAKLNPNNIRALYGLLLTTNNIATSPKCPASKKKEAIKLSEWASKQIEKQYENKVSNEDVKNIERLLGQLQLEA